VRRECASRTFSVAIALVPHHVGVVYCHHARFPRTSYAVVIERADDGGYGAWCPDLPGCAALADTEAEVLDEMRRAIEFHLDGLREDGQPIPHPSTVAATVISLDAA
jgi:predicted RNase H-like HicB family nuclease